MAAESEGDGQFLHDLALVSPPPDSAAPTPDREVQTVVEARMLQDSGMAAQSEGGGQLLNDLGLVSPPPDSAAPQTEHERQTELEDRMPQTSTLR